MNNTTLFHNENNCTSVQESIQTTSNVLYTVKEVRKQSLELFLEQYEGKDLTDPFDVKELN